MSLPEAVRKLGPLHAQTLYWPTRCTELHQSSHQPSNCSSSTLPTCHETMPANHTMRTQLRVSGLAQRCQSFRITTEGGFLTLRPISRATQTTRSFTSAVTSSQPALLSSARSSCRLQLRGSKPQVVDGWTGRAAFSTSSARRAENGENPPAPGEGKEGAQGKAGEHEMTWDCFSSSVF